MQLPRPVVHGGQRMNVRTLGPLSRDGICRGFLHLWQPRQGYRFNLDSVLLAALCVEHAPGGLVVDAGAGSGIMGLYVAKSLGNPVLLTELQAPVAALAHLNAAENAQPRVHVVQADFRRLPVRDSSVSALLCNPPYAIPGTGKVSPSAFKRLSKEAVHGGAQEVLQEAERVLSHDGELFMVTPAQTAANLRSQVLQRHRLIWLSAQPGGRPDRAMMVYGRRDLPTREEHRAVHQGKAFADWVDTVLER